MPIRRAIHCQIIILLAVVSVGVKHADAQHAIDVERLAAEGEYYEAWLQYTQLPRRRRTTAAVIAAAKSAMALGLAKQAQSEFDLALADDSLRDVDRARIALHKGVIEFQEGRYRVAIIQAEKAIQLIDTKGPLQARAWLLWAESLSQLGQHGAAEPKYRQALSESLQSENAELSFKLAECLFSLGKYDEAEKYYKKVPTQSVRSSSSIRQLAAISLERKDYKRVQFWLSEGRKRFPNQFLDSWVDYAFALVAIDKKDDELLTTVLERAVKRYPPADHWRTLLEAAAEEYNWKRGSFYANAEKST